MSFCNNLNKKNDAQTSVNGQRCFMHNSYTVMYSVVYIQSLQHMCEVIRTRMCDFEEEWSILVPVHSSGSLKLKCFSFLFILTSLHSLPHILRAANTDKYNISEKCACLISIWEGNIPVIVLAVVMVQVQIMKIKDIIIAVVVLNTAW